VHISPPGVVGGFKKVAYPPSQEAPKLKCQGDYGGRPPQNVRIFVRFKKFRYHGLIIRHDFPTRTMFWPHPVAPPVSLLAGLIMHKLRDCPPALQNLEELVDDLQMHSAFDLDQYTCSDSSNQSEFLNSLNLGTCIQDKQQQQKKEQGANEKKKETCVQNPLAINLYQAEGGRPKCLLSIEFREAFHSKPTISILDADPCPRFNTTAENWHHRTRKAEIENARKIIAHASCQVCCPSNAMIITPATL
jgi:hypothetical protein